MDSSARQVNLRNLTILILRLVMVYVFLRAALPKIQDPVSFAVAVSGFRVTGPSLSMWIALILPWLELVTALGLLIPNIRRASGLVIAVLLILFIGLHTSAWIRGLDIHCGCFGKEPSIESPNYLWLILRNSLLLISIEWITWRDFRNKSCPQLILCKHKPLADALISTIDTQYECA